MNPLFSANRSNRIGLASTDAEPRDELLDRSIGDLIRESCKLSDANVDQIVVYQRKHNVRFGEAAVALKLVTRDDVLRALSRQFHYPYSAPVGEGLRNNSELVTAAEPFGDDAEAFRELRSQLLMSVLAPDQPRRTLAVMSPDVGDGKTYVAANIAVAFSQLGAPTLLIDGDMRTPRLHKVFGLGDVAGLSGMLSGRSQPSMIAVPDLPSLHVLPVGPIPPNPLELVQGRAFAAMLAEFASKFLYVVIDTPASSHGADARVIAAQAGAALVVGREGKSKISSIQALLRSLTKSHSTIAGVVMNKY